MASWNNNFNFDIPGIIIFLAFIFCQPVGIFLLMLKLISRENKKAARRRNVKVNTNTSQTYYNRESSAKNNAKNTAEAPKRKSSKQFRLLSFGSACSLIIAIFCFLGQISAGFITFTPIALALFFLAMSAVMFVGSTLTKKRDTRLSRIRAIIGGKDSINLTKLANASREDIDVIRRDVQKLIDNGEFGDGAYIDLGTNNFMRFSEAVPDDPETFDYKTLYDDVLKNSGKQETAQEDEEELEIGGDTSDKEHFEKIIRRIRRLNDEIEDKEVSDKIDIIEGHTKNIFDYVTENPEAMPQIRTFMNYYLPTTLKLLQSYSRIERVGVAGENMQRSKENIEKTLDLLVVGFEQQVDQLFKNEYIDISSDISVLEQMMQKDGLDTKGSQNILSYLDDDEADDGYSDDIGDGLVGGAAAQSVTKNFDRK